MFVSERCPPERSSILHPEPDLGGKQEVLPDEKSQGLAMKRMKRFSTRVKHRRIWVRRMLR